MSIFSRIFGKPERPSAVEAWLSRVSADDEAWRALLTHAETSRSKPRPSGRWSKTAATLVASVGAGRVQAALADAMEAVVLGPSDQTYRPKGVPLGISEAERDVFRGLIWAAIPLADAGSCQAVAEFAVNCFRKIPDFGPRSTKLGNAALHFLGTAPEQIGIVHLTRISTEVKYPSAKRQIDRVLTRTSQATGLSRDELEELEIPDGGIDADGMRRIVIGDYQAEIQVDGLQAKLRWIGARGKGLKNAPKALRDAFGEEVKALKREHKELSKLLVGQASRLERMFLSARTIAADVFEERYAQHAVVGQLVRRLLWYQADDPSRSPLRRIHSGWQSLGGEVTVAPEAELRIWHPIECGDLQELTVWRDLFAEEGLRQPFAQLHREGYRVEEPEAQRDNRFAGNVLKQVALRQACQERGWQYQLQGYWDSANAPTLWIHAHNLAVEFDADPIDHRGDDHTFSYLVSGDVRFHRNEGRGILNPEPLHLREIDPLAFSEAMRDVGQIIARSTIAVDEEFAKKVRNSTWVFSEYFNTGAWGELAPAAEVRKQVVEAMLPRTTLRDAAVLEGKWLVVRGPDETYRIHLGSTQIQRVAGGETVFMRADAKVMSEVEDVFFPFEGDALLRKLMAKALVLARVGHPEP